MAESIGYLEITNDSKFVWDRQLNLSQYNKHYKWRSWELNTGDPITKQWHDYEIDISDIPPSIFFMAVVNTYSTGFSLYIPLDESLWYFSENVASDIRQLLEDPSYQCNRIHCIARGVVDLEYLNQTGKIKSTGTWNYHMAKCGSIHIWESANGLETTGTIQGIVEDCRRFLSTYASDVNH